MFRIHTLALLAAALSIAAIPADAMTKAQLVDHISSGSKISKADAQRALDAFIAATTKALKKGDRIALVGFGSFSVSKRTASSNGCASSVDVGFSPSAAFAAKKEEGGRHTPFHNKIARIEWQRDGSAFVFGPNNGAPVSNGENAITQKRPGRAPSDPVIGTILGVLVRAAGRPENSYEILENGAGKSVLGVVLGGVGRADLEVGGSLETLPPDVEDAPIGKCPEGGYEGAIVSDGDIFKDMLAETRLPEELLAAAYAVLLDTIVAAVNGGDVADLEEFGLFVEETVLSASAADDPCAGLPENCPPDTASATVYPYIDVTVSVQSGAYTNAEIDRIQSDAAALARRAAAPQHGKEIKIAAKKVVKFKAGADLAKKVN